MVNGWSYEELRRILFEYGEERYAPAIARHIVERREKAPIETTGQLVEVIRSAMPPAALREKQHPAKRSFRPSASLSTASWRSCRPCCVQRRSGCIPADGWR